MSTNPAVPRFKRRVLLASTATAAVAAGGLGAWYALRPAAEGVESAPVATGSKSETTPLTRNEVVHEEVVEEEAEVEVEVEQAGPVGWATENGGTTGGAGGEEIAVTDFGTLTEAANASGAAVLVVSGSIDGSGMVRVASDKTIIGESGAALNGFGFNVSGASNVIIANLTFDGWDDDAINVQEGSTNIWIDHNTFGIGYDGVIDIKRESDFCTVSWNRINGHDKCMLLGHSDDHTADIGHLRVTYHHNFFDGTVQRTPRVRFAEGVHVYNNYYRDIGSYGVAATMDAGVILEANYFENVDDPVHIGEGDSAPGRLVAFDNHLDDSSEPDQNGSVSTDLPYSYSTDPADQVSAIVSGGAGAA